MSIKTIDDYDFNQVSCIIIWFYIFLCLQIYNELFKTEWLIGSLFFPLLGYGKWIF